MNLSLTAKKSYICLNYKPATASIYKVAKKKKKNSRW